ncbi:transcriptional regulator [Prauserella sp. PE36]|uniref:BTAD domain-containing putative transcriptional regulator n=1 Tax=Prauserella sp. PE36 TaxID=1504709 RepID=UPI000DE3A8B8|nr:BTAD domain-containing putative transcriptional regulator [Prauserella sp. PE36]RBM22258.1 transcriptional regulator [Prauserella sp. PE36]
MTAEMTDTDGPPRRLGEVVAGLRVRAGLTQRQLADLAGLSLAGLRDVEQGRVVTPRPANLRRLAAALGLSHDEAEDLVELSRRGQPAEQHFRIRVLGPLAVTVNGVEVDPGPARQQALLGLLALTPNVPVSRDALIEAAWGERRHGNTVSLVQTSMSRLRQRLVPKQPGSDRAKVLTASRGRYRLTVTREQLDLLEFRHRAAEARQARKAGDAARACVLFRKALSLWRGEPLANLETTRVQPLVTALVEEWKTLVVDYAETATQIGCYDEVLPELRRLVGDDPLHEVATARLMIALAGSGQQAAALNAFDEVRRRLREELGADPGPELTEAHQRVLRQDVVRADPTGADPVTAHRQLPPDILEFTGREAELSELRAGLPAPARGDTAAGILVLQGMGGVGKTRLAVHLARQLLAEGRYADVQLYVDLRGHADQPPADPSTVLDSFLRLLGVAGESVPRTLDERSALYRSLLHGRHSVVLLDNAASEEQVLPLLPAGPTNLAMVTSRRTLALDGSRTVTLEGFPLPDAEALLRRIVGQRVADDPAATRMVVELCGRLPLALTLAARRLQARPAWRFADAAARLRAAGDRLGELAAGSRRVRAVFDLSYRALDPETRRMFRLLGLHPGEDFAAASAAALAGVSPAVGERILDQLADEHLVTSAPAGRYRLHDLLRDYARDLAERDGERACREAVRRVVYWYLHAADAANKPLRKPNEEEVLPSGAREPPGLPAFPDSASAFDWFRAEQGALTATTALAWEYGLLEAASQLPAVLRNYWERASEWDHWIGGARVALAAARLAEDRTAEARTLNDLGCALSQIGNLEEAVDMLTRACDLRAALGDERRRLGPLLNLAVAVAMSGDLHRAIRHMREVLPLARKVGDVYNEAWLLNNLAHAQALAGMHEEAIGTYRATLALGRDCSADPVGVAQTLGGFGQALLSAGEHDEAIAVLRRACAIYRQENCTAFLLEALATLAAALREIGDEVGVKECEVEAQAIVDGLGPYAYAPVSHAPLP